MARAKRRGAAAARLLGWLALAMLALGCSARASNPRWVTGPPYFTGQAGLPVIWYTWAPLYFTDPGDLSPYVNHAAADAIVAAAASVWNVPTSTFTIAQGGSLDEHINGANSYAGVNGLVLPNDASSGNFAAKQIAVIYDTDGSVTEMLLGAGASAPTECLQYGVTESVDAITPSGFIQHALIVVNGRCTGPAPEQQLQLQYQLERVFGRVIGVGWSQTNDNVFTRSPAPTLAQALNWPIMHPIDIVCGQYTYQCLPEPFTLRTDDIAAISQLYLMGYSPQLGWIGYTDWSPGKTPSYTHAARAYGNLTFPDGQGMQGVNIVVKRSPEFSPTPEAWYDVSAVSGYEYRQTSANPVMGAGSGMSSSLGTPDLGYEGYFSLWIPTMTDQDAWANITLITEPINSLYTGVHAVGPYVSNSVTPSGSSTQLSYIGLWPDPSGGYGYDLSFAAAGAVSSCAALAGGSETSPVPVPSTGWWTDTLCGYGHSAWMQFAVAAGRTATVELTALDENGVATTAKALPVIGAWNATDATGTLPTAGYTQAAFNTMAVGTTALGISGTQAGSFRMALADARGDGRPDFGYRARVLYASSVQPATASQAGGLVTINGSGFRAGMAVLINGVSATVVSNTSNTIVALAPPVSAFPTYPAHAVNLAVVDAQTGGTTTISGALTYGSVAGNLLTLVSAPSGSVPSGTSAGAFAVRVLQNDGVTPIAGMPVSLSSSGAAVSLTGCSGSPCVAVSDASGLASVLVTPLGYGATTLTAAAAGATQSASFSAVARSIAATQSTLYVAAGASFVWQAQVGLAENGSPAGGVSVGWTGSSGISFVTGSTLSTIAGVAQAAAATGPLAAGAQATAEACGWASPLSAGVCAGFTAVGVPVSSLRLALVSGGGQTVAISGTFAPVVLQVQDAAGHAVAGATVAAHQTVDEVQMPCPAHGACPIPGPLSSSSGTLISDANGMVSVIPLQVRGQAEMTNLALACGTQGFLSLSIAQGP